MRDLGCPYSTSCLSSIRDLLSPIALMGPVFTFPLWGLSLP